MFPMKMETMVSDAFIFSVFVRNSTCARQAIQTHLVRDWDVLCLGNGVSSN